MSFDKGYKSNAVRDLLLVTGVILMLLAVLYNGFLVAFLDPAPPLRVATVEKIRAVQAYFSLVGLVSISMSELTKRASWLRSIVRRKLVVNMLLSLLGTFLPIFILDLSLRPFVASKNQKTTIYMRDSELGWRLRPNSEDLWDGEVVKINGKGLRGPELDYAKPANVVRVLYLGDSVTFGDGLKSYEQTFPYLIEAILERRSTVPIETINAGVSGYSPWQEYIYLSREGIKYSPDLVVVSFVLNDVTEKFGLIRFGGSGEGWQLAHTYSSYLEWLQDNSSILYFAGKIGARIRFGGDVRVGAKNKETLDVKSLIDHPDRQDVMVAWRTTLEEIDRIFDFCRDRGIPSILVIFPFRFQFEDVNARAIPQKIVSQYAINNQVPVLDLLPVLDEEMKEQGMKPEDYFLDSNHFSPLGNRIVSEIIGGFIEEQGLFSHR